MMTYLSLQDEKFEDLPKIAPKFELELLQDLYGSKNGVWAVAMQAKFFEIACFKHSPTLSGLFHECYENMMLFVGFFGKALTYIGEVPKLANSGQVFWSGSNIDFVLEEHEMKRAYVIMLEELIIMTMMVEKQVPYSLIKQACKKLCLSAHQQKLKLT